MIRIQGEDIEVNGDEIELLTDYYIASTQIYRSLSEKGKLKAKYYLFKVLLMAFKKGDE